MCLACASRVQNILRTSDQAVPERQAVTFSARGRIQPQNDRPSRLSSVTVQIFDRRCQATALTFIYMYPASLCARPQEKPRPNVARTLEHLYKVLHVGQLFGRPKIAVWRILSGCSFSKEEVMIPGPVDQDYYRNKPHARAEARVAAYTLPSPFQTNSSSLLPMFHALYQIALLTLNHEPSTVSVGCSKIDASADIARQSPPTLPLKEETSLFVDQGYYKVCNTVGIR